MTDKHRKISYEGKASPQSHLSKLRILKKQMKTWEKTKGAKYGMDSKCGREYLEAWYWVNDTINRLFEISSKNGTTLDERKTANILWKRYGV